MSASEKTNGEDLQNTSTTSEEPNTALNEDPRTEVCDAAARPAFLRQQEQVFFPTGFVHSDERTGCRKKLLNKNTSEGAIHIKVSIFFGLH